jgi:hypothetical protein
LPSSPASQIQDLKTKVDPTEKIILSRPVELSIVVPLKAPTWRQLSVFDHR